MLDNIKKKDLNRYFQFTLVVIAAGVIYPLVYLRTQFQETILAVFNMTNGQLNNIYSLLGLVFIFGYLPSGLLSDKFSAKNLLALSLLGTAGGGFWFAQVPDHPQVQIIFAIWGFFTVFTFWSAHMKLVKMLSTDKDEGKFFGILDGGRGVVEAALGSVAVFIFAKVLGDATNIAAKSDALISVIYMYSFVLLISSILVFFFVKEHDSSSSNEEEGYEPPKLKLSDLKKILKNKYIYLQGGIVFMGYSVFWTSYYVGSFLETNVGATSVAVGTVMGIVLWMRPVGGFLGGYLADKIGKEKTIGGALTGGVICLILLATLPVNLNNYVFYGLAIVFGIFYYAIRGTYWSLLGKAKIDPVVMGSAIGLISLIGYFPDIVLPQMNSFLFNTFGGNGGYNAYFIASAVLGALGVVIAGIYYKVNQKERIENAEEEVA
ncbi:nitrate/nitrite transporter NarK [Halanaerobium saccharolyticum]|uniref:Nitrate/nitrite transporter NarK n=1 Tax=Halanaerobium saccharolyticum TaxID=43595 RepID=A0A4R6LNQ6_9FIRM|nr:MFS transporter [Halanaerobium saccharolyticum]TDO84349.1 nitrate/nitrite transporter NarK [Halanaerobium saccharolyticum]